MHVFVFLISHSYAQENKAEFIALGDSAYTQMEHEKALSWYSKAVQADSNCYEASWKMARAYVDVGETLNDDQSHEYYLHAQRMANHAISVNPEGSNGHLFLSIAIGRVALKAGPKERMRLAKSIRTEAEKAIELDPENDLAYHVLGRWHRRLANLSWVEKGFANIFLGGIPEDATMENAVLNFKKSVELKPDRISNRFELGYTYKEMDKNDLAIKEFETCLMLPVTDSEDPKHKKEAKKLLEELR